MISSIVPAKAESAMECSLCESRIRFCDSCGKEFANDEQILHVTHLMLVGEHFGLLLVGLFMHWGIERIFSK